MSKITDIIFKGEKHYITSKFGYRDKINTSAGTTSTFHNGTDYGTHLKKIPQYAIEDGTVYSCGTASDGAKYVTVKYPRINKRFIHWHLDSISVKKGDKVKKYTKLGTTGKTGKATGIHLHLSIVDLQTGKYLDPEVYAKSYTELSETVSNESVNNESITYTVKKGDTLSKIAKNYGTTWQKIYNDNKSVIGNNPNLIKPGQKLVINNTVQSSEQYYIVQKGDNLSSIADKCRTTWQKIYNDNKSVIGNNPNLIKPGQKLVIKK